MSVTLDAYVPFASEVAAGTGLNFYTVLGWVGSEGGPEDNPLNLSPGSHYGNEHGAAQATIKDLNTHLYAQLEQVARASYPSQDAEITAEAHAIAFSPWKGNDGLPRPQYDANIRSQAARAIFEGIKPGETFTPTDPNHPTTSGGAVVPPNENPGGIAGAFQSIGDAVAAIGSALAWLTNPDNWKRVGIAVIGISLIVVGASKALGVSAFPVPV